MQAEGTIKGINDSVGSAEKKVLMLLASMASASNRTNACH